MVCIVVCLMRCVVVYLLLTSVLVMCAVGFSAVCSSV